MSLTAKKVYAILNGKIVKIGKHISSENAKVIEATGLHVYPGFIDAHCHTGLDGYGIGYEGQDYELTAGQSFRFDKNGLHSVTAQGKFKMSLLLVIE